MDRCAVRRLAVPLIVALSLSGARAARAGLPPEDSCPTVAGAMPAGGGEDVQPIAIHEGLVIGPEQLMALRTLVPEEVWEHREVFFHEGMKMEIGPCHRRFPTADAYRAATEQHAAGVTLGEEGDLKQYVAGVPFPPDDIDLVANDAGLRWAWNYAMRWVGMGPHGKFRLTDFPSRLGAVEVYQGSFFALRMAFRADLPGQQFREKDAGDLWLAAGGRFDEPLSARHLAWRQLRDVDTIEEWEESDDVFVYVPTMRKARRAAATWVDGLYMPRYTMSGDAGGSPVPFGSGTYGPSEAISPNAGLSIAATENMKRGLTGLTLRPNAWQWRFLREQDVIAPINTVREGWPQTPDRNFGESGLSLASDRWDVRHAVVLDGKLRKSDLDDVVRVRLYVDWQTQQPLYWISRRSNGGIHEIGILAHRYSGDQPDYPALADGAPARVFDPVGAVFYGAREGGTGWRRESWAVRSVPTEDVDVRAMTSTDSLMRGR